MKKSTKPFVLVRTYSAGVHCGTLVARQGAEVTLSNARRLWRWRGANTLHEVAIRGVDSAWTRISEPVSEILLRGAIEVLLCSADAAANLSASRWAA